MSRYIIHVGTGTIIDLDDTCYYLDSEDIAGDVETEDDLLDAITVHGIDMRDVVLVWESHNPLDN